jgi:hypothetical protein
VQHLVIAAHQGIGAAKNFGANVDGLGEREHRENGEGGSAPVMPVQKVGVGRVLHETKLSVQYAAPWHPAAACSSLGSEKSCVKPRNEILHVCGLGAS